MQKIKTIYNSLLNWTQKPIIAYTVGFGIIGIFTILYLLLVLHKYWQFDFFYPDNYYFGHALWQVAQFKEPIVTHQWLGTINIFGDHFHPVIFFFSILLMIFQRQEVVLIGMVLLYGASAVFAMLVGFKLLKQKYIVWALLIAYFMYLGTQNAMIYGFHEINFMPLFFFMMVYAFFYEKTKLYWISFALLLLTKESMGVVTSVFAIFIYFAYPNRRKMACWTMGISIIHYIIAVKFIIPYFSGGKFLYSNIDTPPQNIPQFVMKFLDPPQKIETVVVSVLSFGLLPILNLAASPLVWQDFFTRYLFAIPGNIQYTLGYHYGVALAPVLFFSSIYTIHLLEKSKKLQRLLPVLLPIWAVGIVILNLFLTRIYYKGPLILTTIPDFYKATQNTSFLWELVKKTPREGSVVTMNHLGYTLSHQETALFHPDMCKIREFEPDYVVFDLRAEQNPNAYFPAGEAKFRDHTKIFLTRKNEYDVYFNKADMYILKKKPGLKLKQCNKFGSYDY